MVARLGDLLAASAASVPDRVAVEDGSRGITYAALELRANQVAHALLACGVEPGERVGLYLDKSLEAICGIYGILKAGAAYVPLDPRAPARRLAFIARDCDLRHVVTAHGRSAQWRRLAAEGVPIRTYVVFGEQVPAPSVAPPGVVLIGADDLAHCSEQPTGVGGGPDHLAYILYTSGSSGDPKGVMLSHRNALGFVEWAADELRIDSADRLSGHAPLHFDLSVFDIFASALAGATLVLVPTKAGMLPIEVARFVADRRLTVWYSVPSILSMLVRSGALASHDLSTLRTVLFAGEVFPTKYLRALMAALPQARFCNFYGPTETNVCTWYDVPRDRALSDDPVPIGRPIRSVEVFAVTEDGRLAEVGETGIMYVAGPTVMQGYWDDPDRTRRSLGVHPLRPDLGPAYCTGDLVQRGPDGAYVFLGRKDAQVKSRGYRIELGEVEAALLAHPAVVDCTVVAVPDEVVSNRLFAHVVGANGLNRQDVARFCAERVPRHMVPEGFVFHAELPRTSTGKVDRQALSAETEILTGRGVERE